MSEFDGPSGACGKSDQVDDSHGAFGCAQVIAEVWTLLDGECTAEMREQLRIHLEACPGCFQHYGLEERIKALVATKCSGDKAPDGLRERLRLEIRQTTIVRGGGL
jgi:anti-sigma factor (TIGR02949 family)